MPERPPDLVVGQGSLGTLFAVLLARGPRRVEVVSRRVDEPTTRTLSLVGRTEVLEAEVPIVPKPPDEARLAVLATRSDEAVEGARQLEPALDAGAVLFPIQNGLTPLAVAKALDSPRVAPTIVGFNAHMEGDSTVRVTSPGDVTTGAMHPDARQAVASFLALADGPVRIHRTDNPRGAVWSKWCISCAINGLAVVAGAGVGTVTRRREGREALVSILTECVDVAQAEHVQLERVAGPFSPDTLAGNATSGLGGAFRRGVVWLVGRRYRDVEPSSIAALAAGRDPEIDALNAEAVDRGGEHGIPTPWNRATLELAREIVEGEREPGLEQLTVLRRRALAGTSRRRPEG